MPSIGSATRTIRFNAEDLGKIEALMKKENTSFNNAVHLLIEGNVHPKNDEKGAMGTPENEEKTAKSGTPIPKTDYDSISEMAALMQVTSEKLLSDIRELLEEGNLYYSEGKLVNPRYEEFERACKGKNIDKILESVIGSL